ncbi:MAG: DUF4406 domain-containing protein [Lachnospiraceae bacterium]|nr:DUF4406 domain-containing protein [Lachnospiraceae bacterium]
MKQRYYISGPIRGVEDYEARFAAAAAYIREKLQGVPVNPVHLAKMMPLDGGFERKEYIDICIQLLLKCDVIAMLPGWEKAPGANAEWGAAIGADKEVLYLSEEDLIPPEEEAAEENQTKRNGKPYEPGSPEALAAIERVKEAEANRNKDEAGFEIGKKRTGRPRKGAEKK